MADRKKKTQNKAAKPATSEKTDATANAAESKAATAAEAARTAPSGADYGDASKEDHRRSGYNMPDSFYETPAEAGTVDPKDKK